MSDNPTDFEQWQAATNKLLIKHPGLGYRMRRFLDEEHAIALLPSAYNGTKDLYMLTALQDGKSQLWGNQRVKIAKCGYAVPYLRSTEAPAVLITALDGSDPIWLSIFSLIDYVGVIE